jgi:molybdopterin-biosynthesis enzyme MoeA-like protein
VPDDVEAIAREVKALSDGHDVVFTTGGVGPTHDDVTFAAIGRAFAAPLHTHPELERMLRDHYREACTEIHLRMARVPLGAELKHSPEVRWPTVVMRNVWVFPGVPELFRMKLGVVREHLRGRTLLHGIEVMLQLEEPEITAALDRVVAEFPAVIIGSYPNWQGTGYKTKVTFDARDRSLAQAACEALVGLLPAAADARFSDE